MRDASILEADIQGIHERFRRRDLTASALAECYLTRVLELDLATDAGPPFGCVTHIAPDARQQARAIDREIARDGTIKPLHGIPIWIKDNVDVEGLPTTCGCAALEDNIAARDAVLVRHLRAAGAVIMGKVGMTELGNGGGVPGLSPYSTMSGRIGNAYDARNPPGGSSSGSAVAVSLNFGMAAVGVDDCASISEPAALNGCVGFRPTVGAISRSGLFTYAASDTSPGPITRTVMDAARMFGAMTGEADGGSRFADTRRTASLERARIGVLTSLGPLHLLSRLPACVNAAFSERVAQLARAGATIVDDLRADRFTVKRRSILEYYNSQLAGLRARLTPPRTPRQLYSGDRLAPHNRPYARHPVVRYGLPVRLPNIFSWSYRRVQRDNAIVVRRLLEDAGCDCAIAPTSPQVSMLATLAGLPHLTVPAGYVIVDRELAERGLIEGTTIPWGISIVGPAGFDWNVLDTGYGLEQLFRARRVPPLPVPHVNDRQAWEIDRFNRLRREIAHRCLGTLHLDPAGLKYVRPTSEEFRAVVRDAVHDLSGDLVSGLTRQ
jgi:amidase